MYFLFSLIAIFAFISVYFFFKAENLHRKLMLAKKEAKVIKKESKSINDSMGIVANRNQEFIKSRFEKLKNNNSNDESLLLLTPIFNHYAIIMRESLKGRGKLHKITEKCYETNESGSYKKLTSYIATTTPEIKRMWSSNNINGYVSFVETLLIEHEKNQLTVNAC